MSVTMDAEWKLTSLSSFAKTFIIRDVPIVGVVGLALYLGNHIAKDALSSDAYSTLVSWFVIGMMYVFAAFAALMTLLSTAAFGASIYVGFHRRQPLALCVRMGIISLLAIIGYEWALIQWLQGGFDGIIAEITTSFGI